jgi:nucleoside 2-deoxyribosyltransferase
MKPQRSYLAHPAFIEKEVRAWELEVEKRLNVDFLNPFYENTHQQDEFKKLQSDEKLRWDRSWLPTEKIVEPDLAYIDSCDSLTAIFADVPMAGTPMELFYAHRFKKMQTFSLCLGKFVSPWIIHHTSGKRIARSYEELEQQLKNYVGAKKL